MSAIPNYTCTLHGTHLPARIDRALVAAFPSLSRRRIRRALDCGGIYLNRRRVRVASRLVFGGDAVEVFLPTTSARQPAPQLCQSDILYHDTDLLIINKPPRLLSQASRVQAVEHLIPAVRQLLPECGTLHIVHRLDGETSGAIMLARNRRTATFLGQQLRARRIEKRYLALCAGLPTWRRHTERSHLSSIAKDLGTVAVAAQAQPHTREAETRFTVLARAATCPIALLECEPRSGRSHQIRAQLSHLDLPLLGDKKYGSARPQLPAELAALTSEHHLLHAHRLTLQAAGRREPLSVHAPLPNNFRKILAMLGVKESLLVGRRASRCNSSSLRSI